MWPGRLAKASQRLIGFINRFHRVSGFEQVVRDYFAGKYKRAAALSAMRLAHRIADRRPNFPRLMGFERALGFAPGGHPMRAVDITVNGMRYEVKSWSRICPRATRQQFLRDIALFGIPSDVRWVFDGRRLGMKKRQVVKEVRRILSSETLSLRGHPRYRHWLDALDRIIVVA